MADFGDGIGLGGGGIDIDGGGIDGGGSSSMSGLHLTYTAQLFSEPMRRGEIQTWEGKEASIVSAFKSLKVGDKADDVKFISADATWGTPFIGGVQAPRRAGKTWTMQVTVVQLRKCVLWTLDFAEIQKNIRTWLQDIPSHDGQDPDSPDLSKLAQWERAKDIQDWDDYDKFKTVDGEALEGTTLELAQMIRKGIESYTIHTPVPTMTMRYFDEVNGTGALLDKYLTSLPKGPAGWEELGGAEIQSQLNDLTTFHTDGSGGVGTITYRWLCVSDKSTPNGDGSCTRVIQFMRVNQVEDRLYSQGTAQEGGLA
ncbi:MAG: hypothetical protein IIZ06_02800 [Kiritimatiellae bacterium]|nr:hypothetical protein [Kiritimatiellia bacterium]